MTTEQKPILVVSAYPGDMEIGMGGTAVLLARAGHRIVSVVLMNGGQSPRPAFMSDGWDEQEMADIRMTEARTAASVLGVAEIRFLGHAHLEGSALECIPAMVQLITELEPSEIYTLHPDLDKHAVRRLAGSITVTAAQTVGWLGKLWAYEVRGLFPSPDRFERIDKAKDAKLEAIRCHQSQSATIDCDAVIGINRLRAASADTDSDTQPATYCEVFIDLGKGAR